MLNTYGVTEVTVYQSAAVCYVGMPRSLVGHTFANVSIHVDGEEVGEIYIGGVQVARGYLNQPELTAERFLPVPGQTEVAYSGAPCERWFRTGDLGRCDSPIHRRGCKFTTATHRFTAAGANSPLR